MRGNPGNEVLDTTVTTRYTQTLHLFLLHMYSYYSTFIVAILLDFANAILYFAYCQYSEQLASYASEFVSIRVLYPVLKSIVQCTVYTIMHAFHCFCQRKTLYCTLIVYITEFSLKLGGGPNALLAPSTFLG